MCRIVNYLLAGADLTTLTLEVKQVTPDSLECRCVRECTLPGNMKLTVHGSGVHTRMPILSDSDKHKISHFKGSNIVHFLNVSYTRTAGDVQEVRTFLKGCVSRETFLYFLSYASRSLDITSNGAALTIIIR